MQHNLLSYHLTLYSINQSFVNIKMCTAGLKFHWSFPSRKMAMLVLLYFSMFKETFFFSPFIWRCGNSFLHFDAMFIHPFLPASPHNKKLSRYFACRYNIVQKYVTIYFIKHHFLLKLKMPLSLVGQAKNIPTVFPAEPAPILQKGGVLSITVNSIW